MKLPLSLSFKMRIHERTVGQSSSYYSESSVFNHDNNNTKIRSEFMSSLVFFMFCFFSALAHCRVSNVEASRDVPRARRVSRVPGKFGENVNREP